MGDNDQIGSNTLKHNVLLSRRYGIVLISAALLLTDKARADFPFIRHAALGEARARLNGGTEQFSADQTTGDLDFSISFGAGSSLGVGPPSGIGTDGRADVYLSGTKIRTVIRMEFEYLTYQGSPGGETDGNLDSLIEFSMPMAQIAFRASFERILEDPFEGDISFNIENIATGVTLYVWDGGDAPIHGVLEASPDDMIRVHTTMAVHGAPSSGHPGRVGWLDATIELLIIDCNANGVFDAADIEHGASTDCNHNNVPDDCEWDCNHNGFGDVCDIIELRSLDCNANNLPDECDIQIGDGTDCNANGIPDYCDLISGLLSDQNENSFPDACEWDTLYVDARAAAGGTGASWLTAYSDLQRALQHAANAGGTVRVIKVADGVYRPSKQRNHFEARSVTFVLPQNVQILGGFAGISDPSAERDWNAYLTVLDGDLAGNDGPDFQNRSDNAYHVLYTAGDTGSAMLDGFIVRGGYANSTDWWDTVGGGLFITDGGLTVRNCTFSDNWASGEGGALFYFIADFFPEGPQTYLDACVFMMNQASSYGGAMAVYDFHGSIARCDFSSNQSRDGGAVYGWNEGTDLVFHDCTFSENTATANGGAVSLSLDSTESAIERCTFANNTAVEGGAVFASGQALHVADSYFISNSADEGGGLKSLYGAVTMTGCTFTANDAVFGGGALLSHSAVISQSLFDQNTASVRGGALHSFTSVAEINESAFTSNEAGDKGGGIMSRGETEIVDCEFENNAAFQGGGAYHNGYTIGISGSYFSGNRAEFGGGVGIGSLLGPGEARIYRTSFVDNVASVGGGISLMDAGGVSHIRNCLISENRASYAGGIAAGGDNVRMVGCTVADNKGGALAGGLLAVENTAIENSIFWGNSVGPQGQETTDEYAQIEALHLAQVDYSTIQGWSGEFGGAGNRNLDPSFSNLGSTDWSQRYRLSHDSPAINSGDPDFVPEPGESDLDGHARVLCGRVDMGAYEFGIGDVNCDNDVDLSDFAYWPSCDAILPFSELCAPLDFDNDLDVDLADFAALQRMGWN